MQEDYGYIAQNIQRIEKDITAAAEKSGRRRADILLLGVTKTVAAPVIQQALDCGITDIGENRVQEMMEKYDQIHARWHLIGHLQTNKVKYIIGKTALIHSVESLALAKEIDRRAKAAGIVQEVLVEVNIGGEATKFGIQPEETWHFIQDLRELESVLVKGLMTVAPYVDDGEKNRDLFKKMRNLFVDINEKSGHNKPMDFLSMGMTGDYITAIEEGATIVRIGTGIFGRRSAQ